MNGWIQGVSESRTLPTIWVHMWSVAAVSFQAAKGASARRILKNSSLLTFWLVRNAQHDFASGVSSLNRFLRLRRLRERECFRNNRF